MNRYGPAALLGIVVALGAVWGLSEAALGMWLRSCASLCSGAIMTGVALFFMAGSWVLTRSVLGLALLISIASVFKFFDALLLSLPIRHGAIANPVFAFFMEGSAFLVLAMIFSNKFKQKLMGQALLGGMAALLAVNLFPLVKHVTGIPACVFPGTGFPLSLYYAPLAIFLSAMSVPLGFFVGARVKSLEIGLYQSNRWEKIGYLLSPLTLILCVVIIVFIRNI